jgi:hypothetical protein
MQLPCHRLSPTPSTPTDSKCLQLSAIFSSTPSLPCLWQEGARQSDNLLSGRWLAATSQSEYTTRWVTGYGLRVASNGKREARSARRVASCGLRVTRLGFGVWSLRPSFGVSPPAAEIPNPKHQRPRSGRGKSQAPNYKSQTMSQ